MSIFDMAQVERDLSTFTINPLDASGFTSLLLSIGINDERKLWLMVKKFLQTAALEIHPDRTGVELTEKQRDLQDAFEVLKDFGNFQKALFELKHGHSVGRSEVNELRRDNTLLAKKLSKLTQQSRQNSAVTKDLKQDLKHRNMHAYNSLTLRALNISTTLRTPDYNYDTLGGLETATEIVTISFKAEFRVKSDWPPERYQKLEEIYYQINNRKSSDLSLSELKDKFIGAFRSSPYMEADPVSLIKKAIRSQVEYGLPVVTWGERESVASSPFPVNLRKHQKYGIRENDIRDTIAQIKESCGNWSHFKIMYRKVLKELSDSLFARDRNVTSLSIRPRIIKLDKGWRQHSNGTNPLRVIGSILASPDYEGPSMVMTQDRRVEYSLSGFKFKQDQIAEQCYPILETGAYLVDAHPKNKSVSTRHDHYLPRLLLGLYNEDPYNIDTSNIIVGIR